MFYKGLTLLLTIIHASHSQLPGIIGNLNLSLDEVLPSIDINNLLSTYNDPLPQPEETFDFIIIGSGSGGSALANRLSENPQWKILLLEWGDVATNLTEIPAVAHAFQFSKLDWADISEKENGTCWGCLNQRMHLPRGRGLGGSTLINFMMHVRGNPLDYERWEAMGNPGWGYEDVLPYFKKLEDAHINIRDEEYRNEGGYMTVSDLPYRTESAQAFVEAAQQAGYPYVDYNGKNQMGASYLQANSRDGFRCSAEKAYLRPIRNRKNLKILLNSRVTQILIDQDTKSAYGVVFERNGEYYKINATKEVILSAGGVNSPQLLMLSGIGPKDHLDELGIAVIKDLPVGKKMYDHISYLGLIFLVNAPITNTLGDLFAISSIIELAKGTGPLTIPESIEALVYVKTNVSRHEENYPDVELIFLSINFGVDKGVSLKNTFSISPELYDQYWRGIEDQHTFQVCPMLLHPKSYGYIKLNSKDPFDRPKIYPQYFTDENNEDIKNFIASIREAIRINESPALQKYGSKLYDKPILGCEKYVFNSDPYWECALRTITPSVYHQVSTCKMGPEEDPEAVVNHRLQVHGIKNLRVVDTSIIPFPLSAHTNIPTIMVGEKAADIIKGDWN